jgi:serine/threonine-protein kinase
MCWRGLIQQGDRPFPPVHEDCTTAHYWETFAATYIPEDATTDRDLTVLMERPDIAAICSAAAMAQRSRDAGHTKGWKRDAWPVPVDSYTVLVHCLAGSPEGETPGAVFGPP